MRIAIVPLMLCVPLAAQQQRTLSESRSIDRYGAGGGASYDYAHSANGSRSVTTTKSVNGRTVPMSSTDEKVISQTGTTTVVERTMRRHDADGRPGPAELERVEITKNADGSTTTATQLYRSDLNGNRQLAERATTTMRPMGDRTETTTSVERPSINGGEVRVAEKYSSVAKKTATGAETTASTYRADGNGGLREVERSLTVVTVSGPTTKSDATTYKLNPDNRLDVSERRIGTKVTGAGGVETESIDVYGNRNVLNMTDVSSGNQQRLQQQITVERKPRGDGTVVETVTVKGRLPNDPSQFGTVEQVSNVIRESKDAAGKIVVTTESTLGRRDVNGQVVGQEQNRSVTVKDPPPPPPPAVKK